jgi:hypothetical protein
LISDIFSYENNSFIIFEYNVQQETWSSEMLDGFLLHQNVLELSNISLERPYSKLLATGKIIKQGLSNQRFIIQ